MSLNKITIFYCHLETHSTWQTLSTSVFITCVYVRGMSARGQTIEDTDSERHSCTEVVSDPPPHGNPPWHRVPHGDTMGAVNISTPFLADPCAPLLICSAVCVDKLLYTISEVPTRMGMCRVIVICGGGCGSRTMPDKDSCRANVTGWTRIYIYTL